MYDGLLDSEEEKYVRKHWLEISQSKHPMKTKGSRIIVLDLALEVL